MSAMLNVVFSALAVIAVRQEKKIDTIDAKGPDTETASGEYTMVFNKLKMAENSYPDGVIASELLEEAKKEYGALLPNHELALFGAPGTRIHKDTLLREGGAYSVVQVKIESDKAVSPETLTKGADAETASNNKVYTLVLNIPVMAKIKLPKGAIASDLLEQAMKEYPKLPPTFELSLFDAQGTKIPKGTFLKEGGTYAVVVSEKGRDGSTDELSPKRPAQEEPFDKALSPDAAIYRTTSETDKHDSITPSYSLKLAVNGHYIFSGKKFPAEVAVAGFVKEVKQWYKTKGTPLSKIAVVEIAKSGTDRILNETDDISSGGDFDAFVTTTVKVFGALKVQCPIEGEKVLYKPVGPKIWFVIVDGSWTIMDSKGNQHGSSYTETWKSFGKGPDFVGILNWVEFSIEGIKELGDSFFWLTVKPKNLETKTWLRDGEGGSWLVKEGQSVEVVLGNGKGYRLGLTGEGHFTIKESL